MKTYVYACLVGLFSLTAINCTENDPPIEPGCFGNSSAIATDHCSSAPISSFVQKASVSPVFNVSDRINIASYAFINSDHRCGGDAALDSVCTFKNDCCNALRVVDKLSTTPELRWPVITNPLIVAAIFKDPIDLFPNGMSIRNTGSIVWTWDSGMGTGAQSGGTMYIDYSDGRKVVDSRVTDLPPEPLEPGRIYTWCVWAWNEGGTQIIKSSSAIPFVAQGFDLNKSDIGTINGDWRLVNAVRQTDLQNMTTVFPLHHISLNLTCEGGTCVINRSKSMGIALREEEYIDFAEPQFGIEHLELQWLCSNSISATTHYNGADVQVLFKR
jgi:hypothetical protein